MSNFVPELNSPISTPSPSPTPERNARGCLTRCPHCGESLSAANSASSTNVTASPLSLALSPNSASPTPAVAAAPAPAKKGLLGLGFLGLGGRRRKTSHRRRVTQRRRRTLNRRR